MRLPKLLLLLLSPYLLHLDTPEGGGGTLAPTGGDGAGLDIAATVSDIASAMGFDKPDDQLGADDGKEPPADGKAAPASGAPAPAPGKTAPPAPAVRGSAPAPPGAAPAPVPGSPTPQAGTPAPAPRPIDINVAPNSWKAEEAKEWATTPETVRAAIHRRELDMNRGAQALKVDADVGRTVAGILKPHERTLAHFGVDGVQLAGALLNTHNQLYFAPPAEKMALLQKVARESYGLEIGPASASPQGAERDAAMGALQAENSRLQSELAQTRGGSIVQARTTVQADIAKFAETHDHFQEVGNLMAQLLAADKNLTLDAAYDQACWATPTVRPVLQAKADAAAEEGRKATEAQERKAAEAAAATARPRLPARQGNVTTPPGKQNLDESLRGTLATIKSRK